MAPEVNLNTMSGHVLIVCTGNICRSPYIERLLSQALEGTGVTVSSAGTGALVGAPIDAGSRSLLSAAGADGENFAARQITRDLVAGADLIIGATREHLGPVVQLYPRALRYSFALHDAADLLEAVQPSAIDTWPGTNHVARVAAAAIAARGAVSPRLTEDSGIVDPFRRDPSVFDQMAREVGRSLPTLIAALRGD